MKMFIKVAKTNKINVRVVFFNFFVSFVLIKLTRLFITKFFFSTI